MAKHFSNSTETRGELSITLYLQSEISFCSLRMPVNATSVHHCLNNKQLKLNAFSGKDQAQW